MTPRLRIARRFAIAALTLVLLSACGISPDFRPRDIDPNKQELLLPSIIPITASDNTNP